MRVQALGRMLFATSTLVLASTAARETAARPGCWAENGEAVCLITPVIRAVTITHCRVGPFTSSSSSWECYLYPAGSKATEDAYAVNSGAARSDAAPQT